MSAPEGTGAKEDPPQWRSTGSTAIDDLMAAHEAMVACHVKYSAHIDERNATRAALIAAVRECVRDAEMWRAAEAAANRVFTGDVVKAGVDFIMNCPLGEEAALPPVAVVDETKPA